jgi:hypothetical protein
LLVDRTSLISCIVVDAKLFAPHIVSHSLHFRDLTLSNHNFLADHRLFIHSNALAAERDANFGGFANVCGWSRRVLRHRYPFKYDFFVRNWNLYGLVFYDYVFTQTHFAAPYTFLMHPYHFAEELYPVALGKGRIYRAPIGGIVVICEVISFYGILRGAFIADTPMVRRQDLLRFLRAARVTHGNDCSAWRQIIGQRLRAVLRYPGTRERTLDLRRVEVILIVLIVF